MKIGMIIMNIFIAFIQIFAITMKIFTNIKNECIVNYYENLYSYHENQYNYKENRKNIMKICLVNI